MNLKDQKGQTVLQLLMLGVGVLLFSFISAWGYSSYKASAPEASPVPKEIVEELPAEEVGADLSSEKIDELYKQVLEDERIAKEKAEAAKKAAEEEEGFEISLDDANFRDAPNEPQPKVKVKDEEVLESSSPKTPACTWIDCYNKYCDHQDYGGRTTCSTNCRVDCSKKGMK